MTTLPGKSYRFARFVVDAGTGSLQSGGVPVPLRPKSFDVLMHFVRNRGRLVTKDELLDHVWGSVVVTENSLSQCIREVRQALEDHDQTIVETVAKRGYIFTPAVTECDDASAPARVASAEPATSPDKPVPIRPVVAAGRRMAAAGIIAAVLIGGGLLWALSPGTGAPPPAATAATDRQSVAVLPFGVLGESTDEYFSVGISEDIAAALGRFPDLAVASPKVVARFGGAGGRNDNLQR